MTEITAHHGLLKDTNLHVDDTGGTGRPGIRFGEEVTEQVLRPSAANEMNEIGRAHV